jgi:hypothetical protein
MYFSLFLEQRIFPHCTHRCKNTLERSIWISVLKCEILALECLNFSFLEDLLAVEKGSEPDFKSLSIIQLCNTCVHLLQNFFQTSVSPLVSPQPSLYRELLVNKNEFTTSLESKLSFVLQKAYDSTISWLEVIVAKQKKFDFRPKDTDLAVIASSATQVNLLRNTID